MELKTYEILITEKTEFSEKPKERKIELPANGATHAWFIAKELNPNCEIKVLGYE
jgi:hypothetical protein